MNRLCLSVFFRYLERRRVVHYPRVVVSYKLPRYGIAGFFVNTTSVDLPFSIFYAVFADKMLVFRRYVIFNVERLLRSQLTAEVRIRDIRYELIGVVRIVFEAVVEVVVHD